MATGATNALTFYNCFCQMRVLALRSRVTLMVRMNEVSRTTGAELLTLRTANEWTGIEKDGTVTSVDDICKFSKFVACLYKNIVRLGQVSRTSSLQFGS